MKHFRATAVPQVSAESAIQLVNRMQMQTLAYRDIFKRNKFPLSEQLALAVVVAQSYSQEGNATTTDTHSALSLMLSFPRSKGERVLRDLQNDLLRQDQNDDNHKVFHWRLKDLEVAGKVAALTDLFTQIEKVILAQIAEPENPDAGRDLVPKGIYFNIVGNHVRYQKRKGV